MDIFFLGHTLLRLSGGVPITCQLAALSVTTGIVMAFGLSAMRTSGNPVLDGVARLYVLIFRGTPLLLQIFLIYYGLGQFRPQLQAIGLWDFFKQAYWCALTGLSLNMAAYSAEIIRGGLLAVPKGQVEAAYACGMSRGKVLRRIIIPIALRQALPAQGNEIILMVKGTSLASTITLMDVTGLASKLASETFRPVEVFLCAGAIYLTINILIARALHLLDWKLTRHLRPVSDETPAVG